MTKVKVAALLIAVGALCAGCSVFFDFNAFASLDKPPAPALTDYTGANGLSNLAADLSSPAVVALLIADPNMVEQLQSYLETTYLSGPLTTPDQQTAAALYSDLTLKTTSGDTLVNNIVTAIMTASPTGNLASIITSIIPAAVLADATGGAFTAMVDGLLDANDKYMLLGDSLPVYGPPPGVDLGDVAQKAAVACLMRAVVDVVVASPPGYTVAAAEAEMFKLVTNDPLCTITGVTIDSDPLNPMQPFLLNIFLAAGVPSLA